MTYNPKLWAHIPGVTYPTESMTDTQIETVRARNRREQIKERKGQPKQDKKARPKKGTILPFVLTEAGRKLCDQMRPHTSWDELSSMLGVHRTTLKKHYDRGAK